MRFEKLDDWLAWQAGLHPTDIELGLERVAAVWRRLQPQAFTPVVITVGGTNGKGSSVAMLEAILRAAGYRVGAYSSPHILRYNERIRLLGEEVTDAALCAAFTAVDEARGDTSLTYFEFGTLAALWLFARAGLDAVVLEVGLGGRLDAVNILDADVALITSVDLDHQDWLGDDREAIGREKAGIFRAGRPAVVACADPPRSLLAAAEELGTPLYLAGRDFGYRRQEGGWRWQQDGEGRNALPLPALRGEHQLRNASAVLCVLQLLADRLPVDQQAVRAGLQSVGLPGRFQVVMQGRVPVILDVAHNPQAAGIFSAALGDHFCAGTTRAVFAMLADKDVPGVVQAMSGRVDEWYLAPLDVPRGLALEELVARVGCDQGRRCRRFPGMAEAFQAARQDAGEEDRILVFGSFYTVSAVLEALEAEPKS